MSDEKKITDDEIKAFLGKKLMECENELLKQFYDSYYLFEHTEQEEDYV